MRTSGRSLMHRFSAALFSLIVLASPARSQIYIEDAFPNLTFVRPVGIEHAHDGSNRLFVVEKPGSISVFENHPAVAAKTTFLNIHTRVDEGGGEEGLLGLAFHPEFPDSPYCYVNYTATSPERTVISRFALVDSNPDAADPASEFVLLEIGQPFPNHNGGQIVFGPDGYLYIGLGDGGSANDPLGNGQNLATLLGALLRIDVNAPSGSLNYTIPPDNPYVGNVMGYREEIYAHGLRNPWRFSFDPATGWLWLGDVGQGDYEEIDIIEKGNNYGWNTMEGLHCFDPPVGCDMTGLTLPIWEYAHTPALRSVTGGFVYRGSLNLGLVGKYIYADYNAGTFYALEYDGMGPATNTQLLDTSKFVSTLGVDENNELYFASYGEGKIYRILPLVTGMDGHVPTGAAVLRQNTPNPFNPSTAIEFEIPRRASVRIEIYDLDGRLVQSLVGRVLDPGPKATEWDGTDRRGKRVSSGVYFYRLVIDGEPVASRRMVLLK